MLLVLSSGCGARHIVVASPVPVQEGREAVLILPGLGYGWEGSKDLKRFAKQLAGEGYDVYIPNSVSRHGVAEGVKILGQFVQRHQLARYQKLHVFAYILGGVTLNLYLREASLPNLASIVYDRGPLQERADVIAIKQIPILTRILVGHVVFDLAKTEYPSLPRGDIPIGLMIENRATWFVRRYKKDALALGPVSFEPDLLEQPYSVHCHVWLDHFEMYHRLDLIGPEILEFVRTGHFSAAARRDPFPLDPFSRK